MQISYFTAIILLLLYSLSYSQISLGNQDTCGVWFPDKGDGTYRNPVIFADYSDPDVIRVGDDFYMVSSSFNCTPVLPILHSKDLVNWRIVGHVSDNLPSSLFDQPQHGKGCWAPSIRFHEGEFYVYYGDPDLGIFMSKSKNPDGPWEPLHLVKQAQGWIDPCPLWDDDGKVYLVHAWAKSRVGFNSVLSVSEMSADGRRVINDGVVVFDGRKNHPTIEGPKFYKRNGYYYIFAPAGGVQLGWQTVLRSRSVFGSYEDRIVLTQGSTEINGPHQGGWIETQSGESWFLHFQEFGAYGRIVHLQPMVWKNDWPVMGRDPDEDGKGEPVLTWKKPNVGKTYPQAVPQTSDEFDARTLGLQWQWHANHSQQWYSLTEKEGAVRLRSIALPESSSTLWNIPNLLLQKLPAPQLTATTRITFNPVCAGEKAGLVVMGFDYSFLAIEKKLNGLYLVVRTCTDADKGMSEREEAEIPIKGNSVVVRVAIDTGAVCRFSFSEDGILFSRIGRLFVAREGRWIGAKVGIFCLAPSKGFPNGFADFDYFRITK